MGADWGEADAETVWNEVRRLSPVHAGMSYARLEAEGGLQWPCYDETHPGELFLHSRLWEDPVPGNRVPFVPVDHDPPVDKLDADFPIRLTTGRRLDSYNTGVQTAGYTSPLRRGESLDISPEDVATYGLADGERVRVVSRRGQVEVPVRVDESLRPGPDVHDPAFPGRRRHEPAHDRRHRPEVRHGRVQGDGDPDREARGAGGHVTDRLEVIREIAAGFDTHDLDRIMRTSPTTPSSTPREGPRRMANGSSASRPSVKRSPAGSAGFPDVRTRTTSTS